MIMLQIVSKQKRHLLNHCVLLASLAFIFITSVVHAATGQLASITYNGNQLTVTTTTEISNPQWEYWGSTFNGRATQMIVIDLADTQADQQRFSAVSTQILRAYPEVKRLVFMPLKYQNQNVLRVVFEVDAKSSQNGLKLSQPEPNMLSLMLQAPASVQTRTPQQTKQLYQLDNPSENTDEEDQEHDIVADMKITKSTPHLAAVKLKLAAAQEQNSKYKKALIKSSQNESRLSDELKNYHRAASESNTEKLRQQLVYAQTQLDTSEKELAQLKLKMSRLEKKQKVLDGHLKAVIEENVRLQQKMKKRRHAPSQQGSETPMVTKLVMQLQDVIKERDALQEELRQRAKFQSTEPTPETNSSNRNFASTAPSAIDEMLPMMEQGSTIARPAVLATPSTVTRTTTNGVEIISSTKSLVTMSENLFQESQQAQTNPSTTAPPLENVANIAALKNQIASKPSAYDAYIKLSKIYLSQNEPQHAERVLNNLILMDPTYADAYKQLALAYMQTNSPAKARATIETYRRLKPNDANIVEIDDTLHWLIKQNQAQ